MDAKYKDALYRKALSLVASNNVTQGVTLSRSFQEDRELTLIALAKSIGFIMEACSIINARKLVGAAYSIAVEHVVAFYDSHYIAAEKERAPLLTLDKKFFEKVEDGADIQTGLGSG